MRLLSLFALALLALLAFTFAMFNAQEVTLNYYLGTRNLPLSVLLLSTLVLGLIIGLLLYLPSYIRLKLEIRRLHHRADGH